MNSAGAPPYRRTCNARLDGFNTFGVAATARELLQVEDTTVLPQLFAAMADDAASTLVMGGGSNLLFAADPPGVVLMLCNRDMAITGEDAGRIIVRAGAGAGWHRFVLWTLADGLCGLENLALIPGTVGAAPIQNIGAYGVEVGQYIHAVEAFDRDRMDFVRLTAHECAFGYRDSLFRRHPERHVVTAVEFALARHAAPRLQYAGLATELAAMGVHGTPAAPQVAEAVMRLRRRKLPDPARLGNAGSFFKNPIVPAAMAAGLRSHHAGMPLHPGPDADSRKLSAAWLIEQCGWRGYREGDTGVAAAHALVLVNHGQASGRELLGLARRIGVSVQARFGVTLEPEPHIVGEPW